ncbi:MAG: PIN domain-containing protein [Candidatus Micrarchaeota archaeon]|nr:PIN domain-containing protein [Candidatus Micrarchaeota archaeon]
MDLVIDANVLFAAFIKNSTTREILLTKTPMPLRLYTTPFILEETYKYRKLLAKKTLLDENEIMELVLELISASNIEIVKEKELDKFKDEAEKVSPRENDAPYFAVALYKNCKIWSNDKPIKRYQDKVDILTTKELLDLLAL